MCGFLQEKRSFHPDIHGMLSKCRLDGVEGTEDCVLALRTMRCRVRDEESLLWRKDMTSTSSMDGSTAVILREKLALKSLDVVDETRAIWHVKKEKQPGLEPQDQ